MTEFLFISAILIGRLNGSGLKAIIAMNTSNAIRHFLFQAKRQEAAISSLDKLIEIARELRYALVHPEAFPRLGELCRDQLPLISTANEVIYAHCELHVEEGLDVPVAPLC
jgi:hypothetical protein